MNTFNKRKLIPFDYDSYQNTEDFIPALKESFKEVCKINRV